MTDLREAAKLALELLKNAHVATDLIWKRHDCCEALKRALAEDTSQERVDKAEEQRHEQTIQTQIGKDISPDLATVGEVGVWGEPVAVWVRPNGTNNSGVAHFGETCPPGWVAAAKPYYTRPLSSFAKTENVEPDVSTSQKVEPVAWYDSLSGQTDFTFYKPHRKPSSPSAEWIPLYTRPQPTEWVGLTDEERRKLRKRNQQHDALMLATEQLLKEKNRGSR